MTLPKLRVVLVTCALAGLAGWAAYLQTQVYAERAQGFSAGIQHYDSMLRRARTLEGLLEEERAAAALAEVRYIRHTSLAVISGNTNVNPLVRRYALREFCAEMPVELLPARNGGEEVGARMIQGTRPHCEPRG